VKVFIRTGDLSSDTPTVIACYSDEVSIKNNAHGEGMTVLHLPAAAIEGPNETNRNVPRLFAKWRELAGSMPVEAEAKSRIEEAFPSFEQLDALRDLMESAMKYGWDAAKWPADAQQRKRSYDEKWKYVADVKDKAREHSAALPRDLGSDKVWPHRLTKHG